MTGTAQTSIKESITGGNDVAPAHQIKTTDNSKPGLSSRPNKRQTQSILTHMAPDIMFTTTSSSSQSSQHVPEGTATSDTFSDDYSAPLAPVIQPDSADTSPSMWVPVQYLRPPGVSPIAFYPALADHVEEVPSKPSPSQPIPQSYAQVDITSPLSMISYTTSEAPILQLDPAMTSLSNPPPLSYYTAPSAPVLQPDPSSSVSSLLTYYTAPSAPVLQEDPSPMSYSPVPEVAVPQKDQSRLSPQSYYTAPEAPLLQQDTPRPSLMSYYTVPEAAVPQIDSSGLSPQTYYTAPEAPVRQQVPGRPPMPTYFSSPKVPVLQQDPRKPSPVSYFTAREAPVLQQDLPRLSPTSYYTAPEAPVLQQDPARPVTTMSYYPVTDAPILQTGLLKPYLLRAPDLSVSKQEYLPPSYYSAPNPLFPPPLAFARDPSSKYAPPPVTQPDVPSQGYSKPPMKKSPKYFPALTYYAIQELPSPAAEYQYSNQELTPFNPVPVYQDTQPSSPTIQEEQPQIISNQPSGIKQCKLIISNQPSGIKQCELIISNQPPGIKHCISNQPSGIKGTVSRD